MSVLSLSRQSKEVDRCTIRFRAVTTARQFTYDFATLRTFVGPREFDYLLQRRKEMISTLGIITDVSRMAFEIELGLEAIGKNPRQFIGRGLNSHYHAATDFVIGSAQVISIVSEKSRHTFRGQIVDGLKKAGLFKLHHELRVATEFSKRGFDVDFVGLETEGCQDFLVRKEALAYEVEAKAFEHDAGANINLRVAEQFFKALRESDLGEVDLEGVPVLNILLDTKLPSSEAARQDLTEACKAAFSAPAKTKMPIPFGGTVSRDLMIPKHIPTGRIVDSMQAMHRKTGIIGFCNTVPPRFVVHLISSVPPDFNNVLIKRAKDAAKRQFSKERPAIIWLHSIMPAETFMLFEAVNNPSRSIFHQIAQEVFRGESRSHLLQLVFSGGSFLSSGNGIMNSNYRKVIFNAENCGFSEPPPLPGWSTI